MAKTKLEMSIQGMTCQGCVRSIEKKLSTIAGVAYTHVNLGAGKAIVEYDDALASPAQLRHAVEEIGFQPEQA